MKPVNTSRSNENLQAPLLIEELSDSETSKIVGSRKKPTQPIKKQLQILQACFPPIVLKPLAPQYIENWTKPEDQRNVQSRA